MAKKRSAKRRSSQGRQRHGGAQGTADVPAARDAWRTEHWMPLIEQHARWAERLGDEAQYALPEVVLDALTQIPSLRRRGAAVIGKEDAAAEYAFLRACQAYDGATIGAWQAVPVRHPLLTGHWGRRHEARRPTADAQTHATVPCDSETHESNEIVKIQAQRIAYAGQLAFDRAFNAEVEQLKAHWAELPSFKPDLGPFAPPQLAARFDLPSAVIDYYRRLQTICGRWSVGCFLTWDLPIPIGPLQGVPVEVVHAQFGSGLLVDHAPEFLSRRRRANQPSPRPRKALEVDEQRRTPRASAGHGDRPSAYETAYRMWLVELAVRRRYGAPYRLTARLEEAFGWMFDISSARVKRIRRIYGASLASH